MQHGVIAVARSALSAMLPLKEGKTFSECPKVSKMLKGMFKLRLPFPKYTAIYDPDIIFTYTDTLDNNSSLLMEDLTKKLCTLLCSLNNQRCQAIPSLDLNFNDHSSEKFTFAINKVMETTKPGKHEQPIEYYSYQENEKLCVVNCLREYKRWTELIRENVKGQPTQLILSYAYPHKPVMSTIIARYVKLFLGQAGIDLAVTQQGVHQHQKEIIWG